MACRKNKQVDKNAKAKAKAKYGPLGITPSAVGPVPRWLPGKLQNATAYKRSITNKCHPPPSHSSTVPIQPAHVPCSAPCVLPSASFLPMAWERAADGNNRSNGWFCIHWHLSTCQSCKKLSPGRQAQRQQFISLTVVKGQQNVST